jgi:hypothetical protein
MKPMHTDLRLRRDARKLALMFGLFLSGLSWKIGAQSWSQTCALPPGQVARSHPSSDELARLWKSAPQQPMSQRLERLSRQFLGRPYQWYVLGEGPRGDLDQCPLWRLDAFDCETFVTTVLALALTTTPQAYQKCFIALRYHDSQVNFKSRHHFTGRDWNHENQQHERLIDVTHQIKDRKGQSVAVMSTTLIDEAAWFARLPDERIRLEPAALKYKNERLAQLKQQTQHLPPRWSRVPYIPLSVLFDAQQKPNMFLFKQIPEGAIIEIVRPNWALKDKIGTNLDVSHLGFAFYHDGQYWFRNASSLEQRVTDVPLIDYLKQALSSPTIRGINLQMLRPQTPSDQGC